MIAILNNIRFEIRISNPWSINSDALILPNSKNLDVSIGTTGTILKLAGSGILKEKNLSINFGQSFITSSGNFNNYTYLIHSCIVDIEIEQLKRISLIGESISFALDLAHKNFAKSIVFSHFPNYLTQLTSETISNIIIKITLAYLKKHPYLAKITFLVETNYDYEIMSSIFKKVMNLF